MCADASAGVSSALRSANVNPMHSRTAVLPIAAYLPSDPLVCAISEATLDAGHRAVYTARPSVAYDQGVFRALEAGIRRHETPSSPMDRGACPRHRWTHVRSAGGGRQPL